MNKPKDYLKFISKKLGMSALVFNNDSHPTNKWTMILVDDDSNKQVCVEKHKTIDSAIEYAKKCLEYNFILDGVHPSNL